MKSLGIALLGFGTVGEAVYKTLTAQKKRFREQTQRTLEIKHILVRNPEKKRASSVPSHLIKTNIEEILKDESVDLIVEVIGGVNPAQDYIKKTLKAKKHVVTANKELLAKHGTELMHLARREGVNFQFEASVAGGIPIIKVLEESLGANNIEKLMGIINGTTNYILTEMATKNTSFLEAIKEAQEKGYAEADPTDDVDGFDASYKLSILVNLAFGFNPALDQIPVEGIRKVAQVDLEYGKQLGYCLKLLAIAKKTGASLEARVGPTFIPKSHPLAAVSNEFNAVYIEGDAVGELMLFGRGAGGLPTASAVCSDILNIASGKKPGNILLGNKKKELINAENTLGKYYVRISVLDMPGVLAQISTIFGNNRVSIHSVIQQGKGEVGVYLVLVTHEVKEKYFRQAIEKIKELECVYQIDNIIRVEEEL